MPEPTLFDAYQCTSCDGVIAVNDSDGQLRCPVCQGTHLFLAPDLLLARFLLNLIGITPMEQLTEAANFAGFTLDKALLDTIMARVGSLSAPENLREIQLVGGWRMFIRPGQPIEIVSPERKQGEPLHIFFHRILRIDQRFVVGVGLDMQTQKVWLHCDHVDLIPSKDPSDSGAVGICKACGERLGWWCPNAPMHQCEYADDDAARDYCIYCGQPEERK